MKKRNFIFAVACLSICLGGFPGTASAFWPFGKKKKAGTEMSQSDSTANKKSKYDEFFKEKHETARGLITLHKMKGKLYFELPVNLLGREMLIGSTVTEISDCLLSTSPSPRDPG